MNVQGGTKTRGSRGAALVGGGQRFARKTGVLARLIAPGLHKMLDRIDRGLEAGSILGYLPDGTTRLLGGRKPGFEAIVHLRDWRGVMRLASNGSIGWYQAWEAGEWDSPDPVAVFAIFNANAVTLGKTGRAKGLFRIASQISHWLNRNSKAGAQRNIRLHYDLGNDFYAEWLDPTMSYSSAIFDISDDLEAAQRRKWVHLSKRLGKPKTVLEIGCGWGALAGHLADEGAKITAISLSNEQLDWAREHNDGDIEFRKQDYRDTNGQYDAIVSAEMVEAVGQEYWPSFFDCIARNLRPGGRAAIQFISIDDAIFDAYAASADFIQAYIFPGGLLIRTSEFQRLAARNGLRWEDQHDFAEDYAKTLKIWRDNFDAAVEEGRLPIGFDAAFIRLWRYYLMYCEGGFRAGGITVSQVTLIKN